MAQWTPTQPTARGPIEILEDKVEPREIEKFHMATETCSMRDKKFGQPQTNPFETHGV